MSSNYPPQLLVKQVPLAPPPYTAPKKVTKKKKKKKSTHDPRLIQCQKELIEHLNKAIEHIESDSTFIEFTTVHHGYDPILQGYPISIFKKALINIQPQFTEKWTLWLESFDRVRNAESDSDSDSNDRVWDTSLFCDLGYDYRSQNLNGWFIWITKKNSSGYDNKIISISLPPWDRRTPSK